MRESVTLLTLIVAVTLLSGCAASSSAGTGTGSGNAGSAASGPGGGGGVTSANECSVAHDALAKVVTGGLSAPYQKDDVCYFGVGPNGSKSGASLAQIFADSVNVRYITSDVDSQYQGAKLAYGGSTALSGVGTEAQYYDGGNGNPQVFARTSTAFCDVQTNFNDASEVGLTAPAGSRTIAAADVPKLASSIGAVCSKLFGS